MTPETVETPVTEAEIKELVDRFYKDFAYDCHQPSTIYDRSQARKELVAIGPSVLPKVADLIKRTFGDLETAYKENVNWDLFAYIVYLIGEIIRKYHLTGRPYAPDFKFGKQNMSKWYKYCLEHQE